MLALESGNLQVGHGGIVVRALIAIALIAIAVGIIVPKLGRKEKGEIRSAFEEVGPGHIEGNLCTNRFFGFSIALPETWYHASREGLRRRLQSEKKSDRQNVAFILLSFKFPKSTRELDTFKPSLFVFAERLSNMPGVSSAHEYLLECFRQRKETNPHFSKPTGPYKCVVGRETFYGLDATGRLQGRMANTSQLAVIKKGYAFSIAAAWESDQDGKVLRQALETAQFK